MAIEGNDQVVAVLGKDRLTFSNFTMLAVSSWQRASTFNCTCDPSPEGTGCLEGKRETPISATMAKKGMDC